MLQDDHGNTKLQVRNVDTCAFLYQKCRLVSREQHGSICLADEFPDLCFLMCDAGRSLSHGAHQAGSDLISSGPEIFLYAFLVSCPFCYRSMQVPKATGRSRLPHFSLRQGVQRTQQQFFGEGGHET